MFKLAKQCQRMPRNMPKKQGHGSLKIVIAIDNGARQLQLGHGHRRGCCLNLGILANGVGYSGD